MTRSSMRSSLYWVSAVGEFELRAPYETRLPSGVLEPKASSLIGTLYKAVERLSHNVLPAGMGRSLKCPPTIAVTT